MASIFGGRNFSSHWAHFTLGGSSIPLCEEGDGAAHGALLVIGMRTEDGDVHPRNSDPHYPAERFLQLSEKSLVNETNCFVNRRRFGIGKGLPTHGANVPKFFANCLPLLSETVRHRPNAQYN